MTDNEISLLAGAIAIVVCLAIVAYAKWSVRNVEAPGFDGWRERDRERVKR